MSRSGSRYGAIAAAATAIGLCAAGSAAASTAFTYPTAQCTLRTDYSNGPSGDCSTTPLVGETDLGDPEYFQFRVLLKFDGGPELPPGAVVDGVRFSPGCEGTAGREAFKVYPMTTAWDPYTADWLTSDGSTPWTPDSSTTPPTPAGGAEFDHGPEIDPADDADIIDAEYGVLMTLPGGGGYLCNPAMAFDYHT